MRQQPILYKIKRNAASGDSIAVETLKSKSTNKPHILFCSGFHSSMRGLKADFINKLCRQNGWGFTRFDYQGHGVSDGNSEYCSLHDWLGDTVAVLDDLNVRPIIVGSSMGAWLAVHAAVQRPDKVCALVTIAAAPDFTEQLLWPAMSEQQKLAINAGDCVVIPTQYDGNDWRLRRCLFDSGRDLTLLDGRVSLNFTMPVRMIHGTGDADVPWIFSQRLLELFKNSDNASLTLLRGADHRLSDNRSLNELECSLNGVATLLS